MAFKLLISGESNAGKTSLTRSMKDTLVISHDGKPYQFAIPHGLMTDATTAEAVISFTESKALAYKEKYGKLPASIVFDSVSCIYDSFYDSCNRRFTGFTIYSQLDREIKQFADFLEELLANGINIVILSHALYDSETSKHNLVGKGSFAKRGGFLSAVEESIFITAKNDKRVLYFRSTKYPARTLLEDMPDFIPVEDFDLQNHIAKLSQLADVASEFSL